MDLYVGTSGYSYKEWKGIFYPEDLRADQMLHFYGEHFSTVEINNTFHRMPKESVLSSWAAAVPAGFRFVLKAPQLITHIHRLKNVEESLAYFLKVAGTLQERLGPLLFQLPPNMKKDTARLGAFLDQIGKPLRVALEFRHESWFDDEVYTILRKHRAAMCIADAETDLAVPFVATADWGYLRLRRQDYGAKQLADWCKRIRAQDWADAYVFFKHEDLAKGPAFARQFLQLTAKASGTKRQRSKASRLKSASRAHTSLRSR